MGKTFKCGECGTKYSTPGNIPPPSPNWADGHVCIMMEVIESLIPTRGNIYGHSHVNMETGELIVSKEASERVFGYANSTGKPLQTETPVFDYDDKMNVRLVKRNSRLFTPADFDISPYFDVIKNPFYGETGRGSYRDLPWAGDHISSPDGTEIVNTRK